MLLYRRDGIIVPYFLKELYVTRVSVRFLERLRRSVIRRLLGYINRSGMYFSARLPTHLSAQGIELHDFLGDWQHDNPGNSRDMARLLILLQIASQVRAERMTGAVAELGVFRGNSARILSRVLLDKTIYLFDTFTGFDERDAQSDSDGASFPIDGFADTALDRVQAFVGMEERIVLCPGYFPHTADRIPENERFCLVHLDADLYAPIRAGLEFFYPRLVNGGVVIVHDYNNTHWPGVRQAVDEFLADKPEKVIPMPDRSGTVVFRRWTADDVRMISC